MEGTFNPSIEAQSESLSHSPADSRACITGIHGIHIAGGVDEGGEPAIETARGDVLGARNDLGIGTHDGGGRGSA